MTYTIEELKRFLEHAPPPKQVMVPDLVGFVNESGEMVCNVCAGRLNRRGVLLPGHWKAKWRDGSPHPPCSTCGAQP